MATASRKIDDPDWRRWRAKRAAAARNSVDNHIKALVDAAPPLTTEQRDKLALLLCGGGNSDAA